MNMLRKTGKKIRLAIAALSLVAIFTITTGFADNYFEISKNLDKYFLCR
jgi:hypothetical protein